MAPSAHPEPVTRALWWQDDALQVIDQTALPHELRVLSLSTLEQVCHAIRTMQVRGAPLIGVAAAFGLALAVRGNASAETEDWATRALLSTRPTAVNLAWALARLRARIAHAPGPERAREALAGALLLLEEEASVCERIGENGLVLLRELAASPGGPGSAGGAGTPVEVLTHCNAGWLATGRWGTALAPVYKAHEAGIPVHVWVDETRPRGQGASLTAWELAQAGVPHTVIADTAAGHLMQRGRVHVVFVGSDRTTAAGDVCNKIGTYLVALAARESRVPFYAAVPTSSIDWAIEDGVRDIPIEERDPSEVSHVRGRSESGTDERVLVTPRGTPAANPAFDVTPARLVTGILTELGVFPASQKGLDPLRTRIASGARA